MSFGVGVLLLLAYVGVVDGSLFWAGSDSPLCTIPTIHWSP